MKIPSGKVLIREIESYIIISLGLILNSFAWVAILMPAKVVGGGITGVCMLIFEATGGTSPTGELIGIPLGVTYPIINIVLLLAGLYFIGLRFCAKTVFALFISTVALSAWQLYLPVNVLGLADDKLLSAIMGGVLCGLGMGFCFSQGGSTGGTDIIAMMVTKYRNTSLGRVLMMCDIIIISSSYFVLGNITSIIYGFINMAGSGYTIDLYLQGSRQSSQLFIISKKYDQIADAVMEKAQRGVTILNGEGWYTKQPQKIVVVFCRKNETNVIYRIIKEIDDNAFISNATVSGVYGKGFDVLKTKYKKNIKI